MNEQTTKLIEQLAAKLGTTAEYLWTVLIAQARIEAIECAIVSLIFLILTLVSGLTFFYCRKKYLQDDEDGYMAGQIFSSVIGVFCVIPAIMYGVGIVTPMMNPEYWALKQILNQI